MVVGYGWKVSPGKEVLSHLLYQLLALLTNDKGLLEPFALISSLYDNEHFRSVREYSICKK